jgi:hypothetical protein
MEMALVLGRPCSVILTPPKGLGSVLNRGVVKGCRVGSCGTRGGGAGGFGDTGVGRIVVDTGDIEASGSESARAIASRGA